MCASVVIADATCCCSARLPMVPSRELFGGGIGVRTSWGSEIVELGDAHGALAGSMALRGERSLC